MSQLVLSIFPGIGMLDMAFELEGYAVVRGPDVLWGGDIRRFHSPAGKFDGIIGGPPCQMFSSLARLVEANGHKTRFGNLIPEFERCVKEAEPDWFLMENVPQAPVPNVDGYFVTPIMLDNSAIAGDDGFGQEQRRIRRFCFGTRSRQAPNLMRWIDMAVFFLPDPAPAVCGGTSMNAGCLGSSKEAKERKTRKGPVISQPAIPGDGFAHTKEGRAASRVQHESSHAGHGKPPGSKTRKGTVSGSNGGAGGQNVRPGAGNNGRGRYKLVDAISLQGLPEGFLDDAPFTAEGKLKAVANGVPLPMGRAIARAIKEAIHAT